MQKTCWQPWVKQVRSLTLELLFWFDEKNKRNSNSVFSIANKERHIDFLPKPKHSYWHRKYKKKEKHSHGIISWELTNHQWPLPLPRPLRPPPPRLPWLGFPPLPPPYDDIPSKALFTSWFGIPLEPRLFFAAPLLSLPLLLLAGRFPLYKYYSKGSTHYKQI